MDGRHLHGDGAFNVGASGIVRKEDAFGNPLLRVGDVVASLALESDPGTVTRILQVNANGAYVVEVKWFTWDNGRKTQEYITELRLVSEP